MKIQEIPASTLDASKFIEEQIRQISQAVGGGTAINALSGGVDSSAVTLLGHKALGDRLTNLLHPERSDAGGANPSGFMLSLNPGCPRGGGGRARGVPRRSEGDYRSGGKAGSGHSNVLQKCFRPARETAAPDVCSRARSSPTSTRRSPGSKGSTTSSPSSGSIPNETFGYRILEPLVQLRKDGVRKVAEALGLPPSVFGRMPFPGPALAARVIGEATAERLALVRKATVITEDLLAQAGAFQCMAILHEDRVTGMRDGRREFGFQIEIRCWDSVDARHATPTRLPWETLEASADAFSRKFPASSV